MSEEKNIPPEEIPQEQPVHKEPVDETTSSAEPITEAEQLITHNSKLIPNDMEVHHHTHSGHHKKTWKDYFWEFLMLFLAVFCGFLAEYQLEHKIERDRAKEFAMSLVQDLKNDTTAMNLHKKSGDIYCAATDSLFNLNTAKLEGTNAAEFSFYTRFMYWTGPMPWNRATFEQIKNSGSLRYFKNHELLQKLMKYNAVIENYEAEYENRMVRGNMMLSQINQIIEPQIHHDLSSYRLLDLDTMSVVTKKNLFSRKVSSLESKRATIQEMLNMCIVQQRNIQYINNTRLLTAKALATELISELKKEYNLK